MIRLLLVFLCLPFTVIAQDRLDKSKNELKQQLEAGANAANGTLRETDSSLIYSIKDSNIGDVKMTYLFDKNGKCSSETFTAACDSCLKELLMRILSRNSYQWKKINENQYVSRYEDRILIELPVEPEDHSFTLFRAQWTKELYELLLKH